jgi:hypothetical protein
MGYYPPTDEKSEGLKNGGANPPIIILNSEVRGQKTEVSH